MTYSFRLRGIRSPTDTIETERREIHLAVDGAPAPLLLCNPDPNGNLKNAKSYVLSGRGYASPEHATEAGRAFKAALTIALARHRVGMDFGDRAKIGGVITSHGQAMFEARFQRRMLSDTHGLMTFASDPAPAFMRMEGQMLRGTNLERFVGDFESATRSRPRLSDREQLAFTLFNLSFFGDNADSRFVLLVMAVEATVELANRCDAAVRHVNDLVERTKGAQIPEQDRKSILGSLKYLRREPISASGRALCERRLGDRVYGGRRAAKFYSDCYGLRSDLVHGNQPFPTHEEVSSAAGELERLVADLLTAPYYEAPLTP